MSFTGWSTLPGFWVPSITVAMPKCFTIRKRRCASLEKPFDQTSTRRLSRANSAARITKSRNFGVQGQARRQ